MLRVANRKLTIASLGSTVILRSNKVVEKSKADWLRDQNSDARRRPKKAVVNAAHSIFWSYTVKCEVREAFFNAFNNGNVIG